MIDHLIRPGVPLDGLSIRVDLVGASITVVGELDREQAHLLADAVTMLSTTPHRSWRMDAAGLSFCDAGGLRAVAAASAAARGRGGELTVVGASRCLRRLLTMVELDHLLADGSRPAPSARRRTDGARSSSPGTLSRHAAGS